MNDSLVLRTLASKKLALVLMSVYALLIAIATIVEKEQGSSVAKALIYYSPMFIFLQFFMVINFVLVTVKFKLFSQKRVSYLVTHIAYVVILIGALITHFTSEEGLMHIREGDSTNHFVYEQDGQTQVITLPFELELVDFVIDRYPGSMSPSSYESYLRVHDGDEVFDHKIFMNNVLDLKGYRFYQASYDEDEQGTILSVNYDVPGRLTTYFGYLLLTLSGLVILFDKHSRFRALWYRLEHRDEDDTDADASASSTSAATRKGAAKGKAKADAKASSDAKASAKASASATADASATAGSAADAAEPGAAASAAGAAVAASTDGAGAGRKGSKKKGKGKGKSAVLKSLSVLGLCTFLGSAAVVENKAFAEESGASAHRHTSSAVAPISKEHAEAFGLLPMQSLNGRIQPINTFASEFIRKFKAGSLIGDMSPEQVVLSIMAYPQQWAATPIIEVKDEELAKRYGFKAGARISYRDAFDVKGFYRLGRDVERVYILNPSKRNHLDREILKLDDKINIMHELLNNRMLRLYPKPDDAENNRWFAAGERNLFPSKEFDDEVTSLTKDYISSLVLAGGTNNWSESDKYLSKIREFQDTHAQAGLISDNQLKVEVLYNNWNLPKKVQWAYFLTGLVMFVCFFMSKRETKDKKSVETYKLFKNSLITIAVVTFLAHTISICMRWYISGYAPWSNSYETMVFLSWAGVFGGFIFVHRNFLVAALAVFFGGLVLLVSTMSWMDPQITPLVPVLKSPWLLAHVAVLVIAYGFLGICCMIGTAHLCLSILRVKKFNFLLSQMTIINELAMILGVALLAVGIFLGAIWANESWGRYWSWDPKESWALITLIVYAVVLHFRWVSKKGDYAFNLLAQQSFLAVLMTFLGVNYFLSGLHSYGDNDALSSIPLAVYITFVAVFILPGLIAWLRNRKAA